MIRVVLADDHKLFTEGLEKLLTEVKSFHILGKLSDGKQLLVQLPALNPDLIIIDFEMPGMKGPEVVRRIRSQNRKVKIIVLTMHEEWGYALEVLQSGANAFVVKTTDGTRLLEIIDSVLSGINFFPKFKEFENSKSILSDREIEVLSLLSKGHQNESISTQLEISVLTVRNHRRNIQKKLAAENSLQMIRIAFEKGLI